MNLLSQLGWLSRDGIIILCARGVRAFSYGFLSVLLAIYLEALGLETAQIGFVLTGSLFGAAVLTLLFSIRAARWGRRRLLVVNAVMMIGAALVFTVSDGFWPFFLAALTGTVSVSTSERGAFLSIEQAVLPQTTADANRTQLFAAYNMVSSLAGALGAICSGAPLLLESWFGLGQVDAFRQMFLAYSVLAVVVLALLLMLSPSIELAEAQQTMGRFGLGPSRKMVTKLAVLFSLDSLAGGLIVQSFLAYWFHSVRGMPLDQLGALFSAAGLLEAVSFFAAARLARRFGLLNTMVFSHLPSNILLMLVPLMPSTLLAAVLFLLRQSLSQMDVPTRQSYLMAVVTPEERPAAAGLTTVARGVSQSVSPALAGLAAQFASATFPFLLCGGLKIIYDVAVYFTFRSIKPPEESG